MTNNPNEWLCNFNDKMKMDEFSQHLLSLWKCDWNSALSHPFASDVLNHLFENEPLPPENIPSTDTFLWIAISSLQAFVQENFLGPTIPMITATESFSQENCVEILMVDGELPNINAKRLELLALAKFLFHQLVSDDKEKNFIVHQHWYIRFLYTYQQILDEPAASLYSEFVKTSDIILSSIDTIDCIETKVTVLLEICQGYLHYQRINHAEKYLTKAKEILHIQLNVEGLLGRRTKYQEKPLPQMVLRVQFDDATEFKWPDAKETHQSTSLPLLLALNDDLRLERITFVNEDDNQIFNVPAIIQLLILSQIKFIQRSQPKDKLADEELQPYLTTLLYQDSGPWPTRITCLLENILNEANHKRTVDRSLKQCEQLLTQLNPDDDDRIWQRFSFVYASYIRPRWQIKVIFGNLMISLGLIKSALDTFLQIQKWDDVITCYTILDLRHKAAEIIQQELAKKPTVELYCLLGDAQDDPTLYEKAWEFSNYRSGRAQRHLGSYYFARKEYQTAIGYLEKSLEINSLQEQVWARLGFSAIELKQWSLAANAYLRYTAIEPNGFECWNNLAKAYIHMNEKEKAHKVLHEALRCNFDNWKVWENFLIVSMDTGNFDDAINAYQRLIELKGKYLDKEVLTILVTAIGENRLDANGRPTLERLTKKLQTLLGHVSVQNPSDGELCELSAQLSAKDSLACAQKWQKAYRCYTQQTFGAASSWSKSAESSEKVLNVCLTLCDTSLAAFRNCKESEKTATLSQLSSARLSAQAAVRAVADSKLVDDLSVRLESIKELLVNRI